MKNNTYSLEFFPPRGEEAIKGWRQSWRQLQTEMQPAFYSVTYGAGGSTRDRTLERVLEIKAANYEVAPHLSCIGSDKHDVLDVLASYTEAGIHRLVTIRGDLPSGAGAGGDFKYARDLIAFIREKTFKQFHIEIAAYPEKHPQAHSLSSDIQNLKSKFEAGANSAITQFFFNPDAYIDFIDQCSKANINADIVPGIMPITNYAGLARFSDMCGAEIPRWVRNRLAGYENDQASLLAFGTDVVTQLCQTLLDNGAPGLHFYSLNRAEPTLAIWRNLDLPG